MTTSDSPAPDQPPARQPRPPRPRGRQPKDPNLITQTLPVASSDDLESTLKQYLSPSNPTRTDPAHTTLEFPIASTTAFAVPAKDLQPTHHRSKALSDLLQRTALTVADTLAASTDPRAPELVRKQKAIAKALIASVQRADGNRYSFHNSWHSAADNAARFSYFCNDSTLNKGRAANEGAASVREGKVARKQVYECQGLVGVKFTRTGLVRGKDGVEAKGGVVVEYRHVQCHGTYEERAPVPRLGSKRRRLMELLEPGRVDELRKGKAAEERRERRRKVKEKTKGSEAEVEIVSEASIVPTIHDEADRDIGLQPLIDFLGNAAEASEKTPTPAGHEKRVRRRKPVHDSDTSSVTRSTSEQVPVSELDVLRRELQEAKARIQRLETEKLHPPSPYPPYPYAYPHPHSPHPHPPPQPYAYPYPYPPPYPVHPGWAYPPPLPPPTTNTTPAAQPELHYQTRKRPGAGSFIVFTADSSRHLPHPQTGVIRSSSFGGPRAAENADRSSSIVRQPIVHDRVLDDDDEVEPRVGLENRNVPSGLGGESSGAGRSTGVDARDIPSKFV